MAQLTLKNLRKDISKQTIVDDLNLNIADGEFVVILGPSGCGKSTTLRMIAGLDDITSGEVYIDGICVNDLEPKDRNLAMVFQSYALYPHMTVYENIAFALTIARLPKQQVTAKVEAVADLLQLTDLLRRKPSQLSGGQRQRVAMGRAMVREPKLFLFDEPLSNLDTKLRSKMRDELKQIHQRLRTTTLYVTHDQIEAMTLADRIVIMRQGMIEQIGTPTEVFLHPRNTFVAHFIGSPAMNLLEMTVSYSDSSSLVHSEGIALPLPQRFMSSVLQEQKVLVGFRPSDVGLPQTMTGRQTAALTSVVQSLEIHGAEVLVRAKIGAIEFNFQVPLSLRPQVGDTIMSLLDLQAMQVFDAKTGLNVASFDPLEENAPLPLRPAR